jgi:hypothetical protein
MFLILQGYIFVHTVAMGTTTECARFFGHSG